MIIQLHVAMALCMMQTHLVVVSSLLVNNFFRFSYRLILAFQNMINKKIIDLFLPLFTVRKCSDVTMKCIGNIQCICVSEYIKIYN